MVDVCNFEMLHTVSYHGSKVSHSVDARTQSVRKEGSVEAPQRPSNGDLGVGGVIRLGGFEGDVSTLSFGFDPDGTHFKSGIATHTEYP